MKQAVILALAVALTGSTVSATDLNVTVREVDSGLSSIEVGPGVTVNYEVIGVLGDTGNLGLALFGFDLSFDGGDLAQADEPTETPMDNFAKNLGITDSIKWFGRLRWGTKLFEKISRMSR